MLEGFVSPTRAVMRRVESSHWSLQLSAGAPAASIAEKFPGIPQPQHEHVHRPALDCNGYGKKKVVIKPHWAFYPWRRKGVEAEHSRGHSREWDR